MFLLSETQVRRCLSVERCISVNRIALGTMRRNQKNDSNGKKSKSKNQHNSATVIVPKRIGIPYLGSGKIDDVKKKSKSNDRTNNNDPKDMTLFKPAGYFPQKDNKHEEEALMGLKVVSVRANNAVIGKSLVPANILLLNAETGEVNSMVAATYLTAARTAAGSAIATEICLNHKFKYDSNDNNDDNTEKNSTSSQQLHLVVIGAGLQIELHIRYLSHLPIMKRKLNKITIVNRSFERAQKLKDSMQTFFNGSQNNHYKDTESEENHTNSTVNIDTTRISPIQIDCLTFKDEIKVKEAIASASVIVTGTNTASPLFNWDWVSPGCHINGVGSYQSETEEVSSTFIKERCLTIVDTIDALQVGDLKEIFDDGDDDGNDNDGTFLGTLGDLMAGDVSLPPRSEVLSKHCTFYKSVGTAIQDIITANEVVRSAKSQSIGTNVDMS